MAELQLKGREMKTRYLAFALMMIAGSASADAKFDEIAACMRGNLPDAVRAQQFKMTSTDVVGTRTLEGTIYAKREKGKLRLTLRVERPDDLDGSAYLLRESDGTREDDIYLSLPRVKNRVRHITGKQASQSLMATDFTYADFKQIQNAIVGGSGTVERADDGAHVVAIKSSQGPYTLSRLWVDKDKCVVKKGEFFEGDVLVKKLKNSNIKQSGKYWYASEIRLDDVRRGTFTEIKLDELKAVTDDKMSARYFNVNSFYEGN
jgi:hypothetical protein